MRRLILRINGAVQGVGFRPFVYRTAKELNLKGYVLNDTNGVVIEAEGSPEKLDAFLLIINKDRPPLAHIFSQEISYGMPAGFIDFSIKGSKGIGSRDVLIIPDIATCDQCRQELLDPGDRRYLYPFINCTNCGPRFTIIERLPYDRANTTMKNFTMCTECRIEYDDPSNRRFHAQPNACPLCGPQVRLYRSDGTLISEKRDAIRLVLEEIKNGSVAAVRGIGGFHLICDATNDKSVRLLRERKRRQEKPFAVMFRDISHIRGHADISVMEEALLLSPERPVVLVRKKEGGLSPAVAPGLKSIGAFLPYSPLHHILLDKLESPVIATSGNLSDEPIVKDNEDAFEKLAAFTDYILVHDRPIRRRCDDSVVKAIGGFPTPLRRSRGYAPLPVRLPFKLRNRVLAAGGFYKNTIAIGFEDKVIMSQHIGDIGTIDAIDYFDEAVRDICSIYDFKPEVIAHDLHPTYETTRWALSQEGVMRVGVQHHFAHVVSCMAENGLSNEVLGVAWDGTGYGDDNTLWGCEFLVSDYAGYRRLLNLRPIRLPGGEMAIKEPRRVALSILFELFGEGCLAMDLPALRSFDKKEIDILFRAWKLGINSPYSSSAGRLFDAVASILGLRQRLDYEGQAAMMVEDLYSPDIKDAYPFSVSNGVIDWGPVFTAMLGDREKEKIPSRFINTLAEIVLMAARTAGLREVCLSGGVFQNNPLTTRVIELLSSEFNVFTHRKVPPNDGCIALGQAVIGGMKKL